MELVRLPLPLTAPSILHRLWTQGSAGFFVRSLAQNDMQVHPTALLEVEKT